MRNFSVAAGESTDALSPVVLAEGFASLIAYADSRPTASLTELANHLGSDIEPLDLEYQLVAEAEAAGTMERCARSLLARGLRSELPEGLAIDAGARDEATGCPFRLSGVFFTLVMSLPPAYHEAVDRIERAMTSADLPSGWLPEGADDPALVELFGSYWAPAVV
jgi:hypothetical protein